MDKHGKQTKRPEPVFMRGPLLEYKDSGIPAIVLDTHWGGHDWYYKVMTLAGTVWALETQLRVPTKLHPSPAVDTDAQLGGRGVH